MTYFPLRQITCFFIPLVAPCKPLLENHDYPVLETSVSDYSGIQSALLKHKPLFMHRSKSIVNRDYEDLADEVLQIVEVE